MGAQQAAVTEIEGVVHGPGRVVGGNVERLEVVEVVFHLRAFGDVEAQAQEEVFHAPAHARDRMQGPGLFAAAGQGHVQGLGAQLLVQGRFLERLAALVDGRLNALLGFVDQRAGLGPLFRAQPAQALEQRADLPLLTQVTHPHVVQRARVTGPGHFRQRRLHQAFQVLHHTIYPFPCYLCLASGAPVGAPKTKKGKSASSSPVSECCRVG